jgi:hypothetical protein
LDKFLSAKTIILEAKEICPYKDRCHFNKRPEECYGTIERENKFVCNLLQLRIMFESSHSSLADTVEDKAIYV